MNVLRQQLFHVSDGARPYMYGCDVPSHVSTAWALGNGQMIVEQWRVQKKASGAATCVSQGFRADMHKGSTSAAKRS